MEKKEPVWECSCSKQEQPHAYDEARDELCCLNCGLCGDATELDHAIYDFMYMENVRTPWYGVLFNGTSDALAFGEDTVAYWDIAALQNFYHADGSFGLGQQAAIANAAYKTKVV